MSRGIYILIKPIRFIEYQSNVCEEQKEYW